MTNDPYQPQPSREIVAEALQVAGNEVLRLFAILESQPDAVLALSAQATDGTLNLCGLGGDDAELALVMIQASGLIMSINGAAEVLREQKRIADSN